MLVFLFVCFVIVVVLLLFLWSTCLPSASGSEKGGHEIRADNFSSLPILVAMFLSPVCCPAAQDQQCLPSDKGTRSLNLPARLEGPRVLEEKLGWFREYWGKQALFRSSSTLWVPRTCPSPPPKKERGRQRERQLNSQIRRNDGNLT